jgi:hypothetical protein
MSERISGPEWVAAMKEAFETQGGSPVGQSNPNILEDEHEKCGGSPCVCGAGDRLRGEGEGTPTGLTPEREAEIRGRMPTILGQETYFKANTVHDLLAEIDRVRAERDELAAKVASHERYRELVRSGVAESEWRERAERAEAERDEWKQAHLESWGDVGKQRERIARLREALSDLTKPCTRQDYTVGQLDSAVIQIASDALADDEEGK